MTVYKVKHQLTYYCLIIVRFLTLNMFIKLLYCFQKSQTQRNSIPSKRYIHFFLKWEPSFKVNQLVWNIKRISNQKKNIKNQNISFVVVNLMIIFHVLSVPHYTINIWRQYNLTFNNTIQLKLEEQTYLGKQKKWQKVGFRLSFDRALQRTFLLLSPAVVL